MSEKSRSTLTDELSYYDAKKGEWLGSHAGEYVLIADHSDAGFFPNYEAAFKAGLQAFGIGRDFLIKQVVEHEPVFVIY